MSKEFIFTYQLHTTEQEVGRMAKSIAIEQTIEMPEHLVTDEWVRDTIIGKVISTSQKAEDIFEVKASYYVEISDYQFPQFLNLLYGNISLYDGVKITNIELPDSFLKHFKGPRIGIDGIRNKLKTYDRPLMATALKPIGTSVAKLADFCYQFAAGGIDMIKDDHSLADHSFCRFEERVRACMQSIEKAEKETGKRTLYFPNVTGRVERLEKQIEFAIDQGVGGIILHPFIIGLDLARYLIDEYAGKICFMGHLSMSGVFLQKHHGLAPHIVLGTLPRLAGFDAIIFPHYGGRFKFSKESCVSITEACRNKLGSLNSGIPMPAGGMNLENVDQEWQIYGKDVVLLIGGSLYGRSPDLKANVECFQKKLTT
ncbi:MAG: RuBisCO large subunit C-terminal-like domain-containing protein [Candidatus Margulisiibacteriota bacterium]